MEDARKSFQQRSGAGSGFCWAASTLVAKILRGRREVDVLSLNAWQMLLGSIPLVVVAFLTSDSRPMWTGSFIAALVFNVVFVTGLGLLLWFYALRSLAAGTAGLVSLASPVVGVVSAWIQLGERPDRYEGAGVILIVSAPCVLAVREITAGRRARGVEVLSRDVADGESRGRVL